MYMTIRGEEYENRIFRYLCNHGVNEEASKALAKNILWNDANGHPEYGLKRLKKYVEAIHSGIIRSPSRFEEIEIKPTISRVDANHALGVIAGERGLRVSERIAKRFGVGLSLVYNSTHLGSLGYYAQQAAQRNYFVICGTNSFATVTHPSGSVPILGTNPIAFACPLPSDQLFVADFSSSTISNNTRLSCAAFNTELPYGSAVDGEGEYTTNPHTVAALTPASGGKGWAIGLLVELIVTALGGSNLSSDLKDVAFPFPGVGYFFLTINCADLMLKEKASLLCQLVTEAGGRIPGAKLRSVEELTNCTLQLDEDIGL